MQIKQNRNKNLCDANKDSTAITMKDVITSNMRRAMCYYRLFSEKKNKFTPEFDNQRDKKEHQ